MAKKAAKAAKGKPVAKGKSKAKGSNELAPATASPGNQRTSITIRKIQNGYVTNQSGYRGDKYVERETFTKAKPRVVIGGGSGE
jgi:hypothetical protein